MLFRYSWGVALLLVHVWPAFGQYVDLSGDWRISKDDNPRYAETAFDDRAWSTVRLPWEVERPLGAYWLRKSVPTPATNGALALAIGSVNESYEVYVNGSRIATTPGFGTNDPPFFRPRAFAVPKDVVGPGGIVIALRILRTVNILWMRPGHNKDYGPYRLSADLLAIEAVEKANLATAVRSSAYLAFAPFTVFVGIYLLWTFRSAKEWWDLFWLGCFCLSTTVLPVMSYAMLNGSATSALRFMWAWHLFLSLTLITFAEFAIAALRIDVGKWRWLLWLTLGFLFFDPIYSYPPPAILAAALCSVWGLRSLARGTAGSRTVAALVAVYGLFRLQFFLTPLVGISLIPALTIEPFQFTFANIINTVIGTALMFLTLHRLLRDKQRLAGEMEAARLVQQLLLSPGAVAAGPYQINVVYLPAQEVGGDFYQVLSLSGDSHLLLAGDVSGKGLKAAMVVSMVVGAFANRRSNHPGEVLREMNRALCGRMDGGFVTCCCVLMEAGGRATIANAGHPPPYLAGAEVATAAGLPLGLMVDAEYAEVVCDLAPNAQLTIVSDGVAEAANAKAELFGFDRTQEISGKTAAEIADGAKAWGQNDDITVVTVRRVE